MKWIPYSKFTNVQKISEGGFGIIYRATWLVSKDDFRDMDKSETIILKRFKNSQGKISKDFLNE
ncbi:hypothetical protein C1645_787023, partial [Glomus cerebriforme]